MEFLQLFTALVLWSIMNVLIVIFLIKRFAKKGVKELRDIKLMVYEIIKAIKLLKGVV